MGEQEANSDLAEEISKDPDFLKYSAVGLLRYWKGKDYTDPNLADLALEMARKSSRKRFIFRVHGSLESELHLMINAFSEGSYAAPHKHEETVKTETYRILKGQAWVLFFDDDGNPKRVVELSEQGRKTVSIRPGQWHTIVSNGEFVFLEAKRQPEGGYNRETDKVFASWAPSEKDSQSAEYLKGLLDYASSTRG